MQPPALVGGLTWNTSQLYSDGVISVTGPPLAGDYNHNGIIDVADYTLWRDTLGQSGTGLAADGTGPGGVSDGWSTNLTTISGGRTLAIIPARVQVRFPPSPNRRLCGCSSPGS